MEHLAKGALNSSLKKETSLRRNIFKKSRIVIHSLLWGTACGLKWEQTYNNALINACEALENGTWCMLLQTTLINYHQ